MASNKYEGLAIRYLIAMVLAIIACGVLSYFFGIAGAAVSTLISDVVLIPFVIRQSLILTQDNWGDFKKGIMEEASQVPSYLQRVSFMVSGRKKKEEL